MTTSVQYINFIFFIGNLYFDGKGVPVDHLKAVEFYIKAANQGNASAEHKIGNN